MRFKSSKEKNGGALLEKKQGPQPHDRQDRNMSDKNANFKPSVPTDYVPPPPAKVPPPPKDRK